MMNKNIKTYKASVLAVSLIILSAILVIGLTVSLISVKERKNAINLGKTSQAFQAANSGIEEAAGKIDRDCLDPSNAACPGYSVNEMFGSSCSIGEWAPGGSDYKIKFLDSNDADIDCNDSNRSIYYINSVKSTGQDPEGQEKRAIGAIVFNNSTKLLIHADGADGSDDFLDSSLSAHSINAKVNVEMSNSGCKFGVNGAMTGAHFGGGGSYLEIEDSDDWNFADNDFIIETWINFSDTPSSNQAIASRGDELSSDKQFVFYLDSNANELIFGYSTDGNVYNKDLKASFDPAIDTWYHVTVGRFGNDLKLFIDSNEEDSENLGPGVSLHDGGDKKLIIGANMSNGSAIESFGSYIDEFRIWKAR